MITAEPGNTSRNKAVVRRLINEVLTGGQLDLIDELYAPELAAAARAWITPFRASFPDTRMEIIDAAIRRYRSGTDGQPGWESG